MPIVDPKNETRKSCSDCRFAIFQDTGYSNYTVEGTDFICTKSLHPDGIFDRFYGVDERLFHADKCGSFDNSEGAIHMDVEKEKIADLSEGQKKIWETYIK